MNNRTLRADLWSSEPKSNREMETLATQFLETLSDLLKATRHNQSTPGDTLMNNRALNSYGERMRAADELLNTLRWYVDDHGEVAPESVTYADVARMSDILINLQLAVQIIDVSRV